MSEKSPQPTGTFITQYHFCNFAKSARSHLNPKAYVFWSRISSYRSIAYHLISPHLGIQAEDLLKIVDCGFIPGTYKGYWPNVCLEFPSIWARIFFSRRVEGIHVNCDLTQVKWHPHFFKEQPWNAAGDVRNPEMRSPMHISISLFEIPTESGICPIEHGWRLMVQKSGETTERMYKHCM